MQEGKRALRRVPGIHIGSRLWTWKEVEDENDDENENDWGRALVTSHLSLVDGLRFDYELIRIESGRLDHARTFFARPIEGR
jgi:hypothetical protein